MTPANRFQKTLRLALAGLFSLWVIGASATDKESASDAHPAPRSAVETVSDAASDLVMHALAMLGIEYKFGGNSPETGFDCSGFVKHVFREAADMALPHNAYSISLLGKPISKTELKPGDLVFFNTLKHRFSHVGIYLGDNRFIHAPSNGKLVEIVDMSDAYWALRFNGARRIIDTPKQSHAVASN